MNTRNPFIPTGLAVLAIITLLNVAGWIESLESRDRYRHCVFQNLDSATTDMEISELHRACAALNGYEGPMEERP
jgi:hypothetical protein